MHLVVKNGKVANLKLPETPPSTGPAHAPFNAFAVTDALLDLQIDDVHAEASSVDLDVTVEDDPTTGSAYELATRVGRASVHRPRARADGSTASDDDALCSVDGRVRVEPWGDPRAPPRGGRLGRPRRRAGHDPGCDFPADDKRRVELSLGHLHVQLPTGAMKLPYFDGHVRARAPVALAERAASLPETDGVGRRRRRRALRRRHDPPRFLSGTVEAHDIRLAQFSFAQELHSQLTLHRNVVVSPLTTLRLGGGLVTLTDTVIDPLAKGAKVEKTRVDVANVDFTMLSATSAFTRARGWAGTSARCTPASCPGRSCPSSSTGS